MNQTRRTLLQAILGLFGLGAAKAVAKTESPFKVHLLDGSEPVGTTLIGCRDGYIRKFDTAVGVCISGSRMSLAICFVNDPHGEKTSAERFSTIESHAQVLAEMSPTAMLFVEAHGPDGVELVAELMKRCPERVWHGRKSYDRAEDPLETAPGVRSVTNLSENSLHAHLISWGPDWDTDDADQATARFLALLGRKVLTGDAKELQFKNKTIIAYSV